jgi:hypothetical protein
MLKGEYTFEYATFRVKLSQTNNPGKTIWLAQNREPNTSDLWSLTMAWEAIIPFWTLGIVEEKEVARIF